MDSENDQWTNERKLHSIVKKRESMVNISLWGGGLNIKNESYQ